MPEIENKIESSILATIKKMIGIERDYTQFDQDIMVLINSYIKELYQIGVGPENFAITGHDQTWEDYLGANSGLYDDVKSYIFYKTRIMFNPPSNSFVTSSYQEAAKECIWRISIAADMARIEAEEALESLEADEDDE